MNFFLFRKCICDSSNSEGKEFAVSGKLLNSEFGRCRPNGCLSCHASGSCLRGMKMTMLHHSATNSDTKSELYTYT